MSREEELILDILKLMPSIGKCERYYSKLLHEECMMFDSFSSSPAPKTTPRYKKYENDPRQEMTLHYQDFTIKITIRYNEEYYCEINGHKNFKISDETYWKVDEYCKKYDYGNDNIKILQTRLKHDIRERKLERLNEKTS